MGLLMITPAKTGRQIGGLPDLGRLWRRSLVFGNDLHQTACLNGGQALWWKQFRHMNGL
ncbi:hypothetical protein [Salaquimonas pukyongi]|uniref:hypothetical protein n=1 Tax=Salaquimonas pukyongi TaxID=2712698 RepID=UPI0012EC3DA8|nr:hypothetical protein [Salaquimonas pukyongi]